MSGTTSTLSQIVAQLESGNGTNVANQPASMVNPTYGQYGAFVSQYGSGSVGVDNYATQMLAANPNATLGDFYSSYVLNTGNPAQLSTLAELQNQQPAAYKNLTGNFGDSLNLPLSSLVNNNASASDYASASDGFSPSIDVGGSSDAPVGEPGSEYTPSGSTYSGGYGSLASATASASAPGYLPPASTGGPAATGITPGLAAGISGWVGSMESTATNLVSGIESAVGKAWDNTFGAILANIQNMFIRGMLILIGIVILIVALWRLAAPDVNVRDVAQVAAAAG